MYKQDDWQKCEGCGIWYFGPATLCLLCREVFPEEDKAKSAREYRKGLNKLLCGGGQGLNTNDVQAKG